MKSKNIWVGVSISVLATIAQAQQVVPLPDQNSNTTEIQLDTTSYYVRPEADGGVTVIKADGTQVYFSKEQLEVINKAKGAGSTEFKNSAFCARVGQ